MQLCRTVFLFHCPLTAQHVSNDIIAHHQELLNCNYSSVEHNQVTAHFLYTQTSKEMWSPSIYETSHFENKQKDIIQLFSPWNFSLSVKSYHPTSLALCTYIQLWNVVIFTWSLLMLGSICYIFVSHGKSEPVICKHFRLCNPSSDKYLTEHHNCFWVAI